jgi:hypothetical protein
VTTKNAKRIEVLERELATITEQHRNMCRSESKAWASEDKWRRRAIELEAENDALRAQIALADYDKNGGVALADLQKELEK